MAEATLLLVVRVKMTAVGQRPGQSKDLGCRTPVASQSWAKGYKCKGSLTRLALKEVRVTRATTAAQIAPSKEHMKGREVEMATAKVLRTSVLQAAGLSSTKRAVSL